MGYKFQFVTLAGFHSLNHSMFELARNYRHTGMSAYADLQQREFASIRPRPHVHRNPDLRPTWLLLTALVPVATVFDLAP